jgi:hypothetical protein
MPPPRISLDKIPKCVLVTLKLMSETKTNRSAFARGGVHKGLLLPELRRSRVLAFAHQLRAGNRFERYSHECSIKGLTTVPRKG